MALSKGFPAALLLFGLFFPAAIRAQSPSEDLAPLPVEPTAEQLRAIASLSPFAEPIHPGMPPENAKHCIRVFTSQGRWPILVEYEDGSQRWGEVSEIGRDTFKLLNRKTGQEETLSYSGIRSLGIVKAYDAPSEYALPKTSERRRLHIREPQLSPEQVGYKLAVQKLGVNTHRFVHADLPKGKVRTGVITEIRDDSFVLQDGIFATHEISYADLKAAPRPVAAVGTRIGHGFKWAGVVTTVVVLLPFLPLFYSGS